MLSQQTNEVVGFNTIAGLSKEAVYAAGWAGEIWFFNGSHWIREDSPTNHIISSGTAHEDGTMFFCGRHGTALHGARGQWEILNTDAADEDLWSVASFGGRIYFASQSRLFVLEGDSLVPLTLEIGGYNRTHFRLQTAGGFLFSFGERDILVFDSRDWARIPTE
jgi:hypothetical protein